MTNKYEEFLNYLVKIEDWADMDIKEGVDWNKEWESQKFAQDLNKYLKDESFEPITIMNGCEYRDYYRFNNVYLDFWKDELDEEIESIDVHTKMMMTEMLDRNIKHYIEDKFKLYNEVSHYDPKTENVKLKDKNPFLKMDYLLRTKQANINVADFEDVKYDLDEMGFEIIVNDTACGTLEISWKKKVRTLAEVQEKIISKVIKEMGLDKSESEIVAIHRAVALIDDYFPKDLTSEEIVSIYTETHGYDAEKMELEIKVKVIGAMDILGLIKKEI